MTNEELDLVPTDDLAQALTRRNRAVLIATLPSEHEKDPTLAHRLYWTGCNYALAKLAEIAARELNMLLMQVRCEPEKEE